MAGEGGDYKVGGPVVGELYKCLFLINVLFMTLLFSFAHAAQVVCRIDPCRDNNGDVFMGNNVELFGYAWAEERCRYIHPCTCIF